ncbi:S9 family peptidase [Parabacteroides pacaensis]|uniref:S9 family peptidase n=1 Tax=Parabacteroides pacaensis TaxID=2086575 RepID=UPI000D0FB070
MISNLRTVILVGLWSLLSCSYYGTMNAQAQENQLTLDDLIPGGRTYNRFVPRTVKQLQWCVNHYIYVKGDSLMAGIPGKKKNESLLMNLESINSLLKNAGLNEMKAIPYFSVPDKEKPLLSFDIKGKRVFLDMKTKEIVRTYPMEKGRTSYDYSKGNGYFAFNEENNLGIISPDGVVSMITDDRNKDIVNGQSVHRNEFGIYKGTFWSPTGNQLAFYRMDQSMVTDYPLVNVNARCAKAEPIKYPMAGMKSHEVTVGIYNLATGKTIFLKTGTPKEKYLTNIAWSPDEKSIYIAEVNREQNECNLNRYNATTGKLEATLFTETHPKYVEPQQPVLFFKNDPEKFIWQSMRDGYNHLYVYSTEGKELQQLTKGNWVVTEVLGFDGKGEYIYYLSTEESPLDRHLYKLNLKNGKKEKLTKEEGVHQIQLSADRNYFIDNFSSQSVPRKIHLTDTKKAQSFNLLTASDPYKNYKMPAIEVGTLKAADGVTDLYYRMITPPDMDPHKKYPAVVYVYGGPHAQLITNNWMAGGGGWFTYMAQRGYVIFTVDSRGSANRGAEFENVIHRNLGVTEMADQVKGVEFLKSHPFIDADRIGVHGWSYGGFMTTNLILTYPEIFKVAVAGGPVIDWSYYEVMYGERYMDTPQENPEGYKNANLKNKAGQLKGHLLLIHGDIDPVVVWQHSLSFVEACVNARTYPDYFVYPRHEHNVIGKDRPHLHEKITRYFDDYLKPDKNNN